MNDPKTKDKKDDLGEHVGCAVACLVGGFFVSMMFVGSVAVEDRVGFSVAFSVGSVVLGFLLRMYLSSSEAEEKRKEEARKAEEERRRNSPEEVEQRRIAAERYRAEHEERERKQKIEEEKRARDKWAEYHRYMRIDEVDGMTGIQFERFIATMFERLGYRNIRTTPQSGDYGADLIGDTPDGKRMVIQAKRWQGNVGISAVQEVLGALVHYDAEVAFVITNSYFTPSATALAKKDCRIHLVDRAKLASMMQNTYKREVPEFDWDKYNQCVKKWRPY